MHAGRSSYNYDYALDQILCPLRGMRRALCVPTASNFARIDQKLPGIVQHLDPVETVRRLHEVVLTGLPSPMYFGHGNIVTGPGGDAVRNADQINFGGFRSNKCAANAVAETVGGPDQIGATIARVRGFEPEGPAGLQALGNAVVNHLPCLPLISWLVIAPESLGNAVGIKERIGERFGVLRTPSALSGAVGTDNGQKAGTRRHSYIDDA